MIYILYRHQKIYVQMCFCVAEENHTWCTKCLNYFAHLRDIIQSAHVRICGLMSAGGADESL